jgi:NTP pyrophosphatase (non-canonical NTP hydrolase)
MSDASLTVKQFQQHIHQRYYETDSARGTPATFLWFMEEVGELATALHQAASSQAGDEEQANLEEEFADVVAWLCTLANINDVDLETALRRKYLDNGGPSGHK